MTRPITSPRVVPTQVLYRIFAAEQSGVSGARTIWSILIRFHGSIVLRLARHPLETVAMTLARVSVSNQRREELMRDSPASAAIGTATRSGSQATVASDVKDSTMAIQVVRQASRAE
jgi:hypothetical protein